MEVSLTKRVELSGVTIKPNILTLNVCGEVNNTSKTEPNPCATLHACMDHKCEDM